MSMILAVDGMGGDAGPTMVVEGVYRAWKRFPDVNFLVFGYQDLLNPLIASYSGLSHRVIVCHASQHIAADTKPSHAVRNFKNSSLKLALEAVAQNKAQAVISAGNTGAYLGLAKLILKTLPGIDRPAIAGFIPTAHGKKNIMLDLGANVSCSSQNLVEFALMGSAFAQHILSIPQPKVAILNVGSELGKGPPYLTEVLDILEQTNLNLYGFMEGDDLFKGQVDVVVTDGFTGNSVLKSLEGLVNFAFSQIHEQLNLSLGSRITGFFASSFLKGMKSTFDPKQYNGALWLGLNGLAIKSHGGTDAEGFSNAITIAINMVRSDLNSIIATHLDKLKQSQTIPNQKRL